MPRPTPVTALACLYLSLGALLLLLALPVSRMREAYTLFGSLVSAQTYMYWFLTQGVVWLYLSYAFFQGLSLGLHVYLALKASRWGVMVLSGELQGMTLLALIVDVLLAALVWHHREWFRN